MKQRWCEALITAGIPKIDLNDQVNAGKKKKQVLKQFWPEFSQTSYIEAFNKQTVAGNYTVSAKGARVKIDVKQREGVVALISELHKWKNYQKETMFIAFGLLDRYLSLVVNEGLTVKELDLVHLAAVCLLLAAKLNQPLMPSFNQMILLLDESYRDDKACK